MGTKDNRVDAALNKHIWSAGIAAVPMRVRIRCSRVRNTEEGKEKKFYTLISYVAVPKKELRHLKTQTVETEAE